MNGMRDSSVAACAISAMSCASCTELETSWAKPVGSTAITSWWSPKIDRPCVASDRAATWMTHAVSSPAILYMLGIISMQALRRGEGGRQRAGLQRAVHRAGGAALALHLDDVGDAAPDVGLALARPLIGELRHRRRRRDRIDRADLVDPVGDVGGGLVAVDGRDVQFFGH